MILAPAHSLARISVLSALSFFLAVPGLPAIAAEPIVLAQLFGRPPADVGNGAYPVEPAQQDAAGLLVRIDRLESQLRQMNGQIEQLQFQLRQSNDQLKKFQQDVEFRFQESGGRPAGTTGRPPLPKRTDLTDPPGSPAQGAPLVAAAPITLNGAVPDTQAQSGTLPRQGRRNDAFDPASQPAAPGAPRSLGTLPAGSQTTTNGAVASYPPGTRNGEELPVGPIMLDDNDPNAPMSLARPGPAGPVRQIAGAPTPTGAYVPAASAPITQAAVPTPSVNAVKEDYEIARGYLGKGQYETAETGFKNFLQQHPKDRLAPDAIYNLGETYFQRGRHREAAEQYLKISTDYSKTARAPDAMVRLGSSLSAMGAKDEACATFAEAVRKYPNASAATKANAERESKRVQCP